MFRDKYSLTAMCFYIALKGVAERRLGHVDVSVSALKLIWILEMHSLSEEYIND